MRFKVASAGNHSCTGDLFYTVPSEKEHAWAEQEIYQRCYDKLQSFGEDSAIMSRFKIEYDMMKQTKTAFSFLLVKEIADLSKELDYPIMMEGEVFGSIISYLLGIASVNPLSAQTQSCPLDWELIWMGEGHQKEPAFSFRIANPIRPLIHSRLDKAFSQCESDHSVYKHISMPDSDWCKQIGDLKKSTGTSPTSEAYQSEIYLCVRNRLVDDLKTNLMSSESSGYSNEEDGDNLLGFSEQLKQITSCDYLILTRLFGYIHGSFTDKMTVENLYDRTYFMLREELYSALVRSGVPVSQAVDIVKHGVWRNGSKRRKYHLMLQDYGVPSTVIQHFDKIRNLWPAAACASRLQLLCTLAWYQVNHADAFADMKMK